MVNLGNYEIYANMKKGRACPSLSLLIKGSTLMNSMTLYVERNSIVHKMDPITKMIYVIVSIAVTYILPVHLFVMIVTSVSLLLLIFGKVFRIVLHIIGLIL